MFWKKNVFSYVLWLALAAVTISGLYELIVNLTSGYQMPSFGNLLIAVAYCLVAYALMYFARKLIEEKFYNVHIEKKTISLLEVLGIVISIAVGGTLRMWELDGKILDSYYFQYAKIGENDGVPAFVHGAGYVYTCLLRLLCIAFGNHILNGVILQLCLYTLALVCFYIAVRMLEGKVPAFFVILVGFCATYMRKDAMILSPTALIVFLIAVVTLLLSIATKINASALWFLPIGLFTGVFGYLDSLCFLPVAFLLVICMRVDEENEYDLKDKLLQFIGFFGMSILGFGAMLMSDMLLSGCAIERILWAYSYANSTGESSVISLTLESKSVAEMTMFFAILVLASVGFILDKHKERISGWALLLLALLVVQALGVGNQNVDINVLLMIYGAVLCGVGVSSFWVFERLPVRQAEFIAHDEDPISFEMPDQIVDKADDKGENKAEIESETDSKQRYSFKIDPPEGMSREEIDFIENPLPLPKKHISKNMDYDIEVADDDDFDI